MTSQNKNDQINVDSIWKPLSSSSTFKDNPFLVIVPSFFLVTGILILVNGNIKTGWPLIFLLSFTFVLPIMFIFFEILMNKSGNKKFYIPIKIEEASQIDIVDKILRESFYDSSFSFSRKNVGLTTIQLSRNKFVFFTVKGDACVFDIWLQEHIKNILWLSLVVNNYEDTDCRCINQFSRSIEQRLTLYGFI